MNIQPGFRVLHPGIMTQLQDGGRFGYRHLGLSSGGPLDEQAFFWANRLLENPCQTAALEIAHGGLQLEVLMDTSIAITGADLSPRLNSVPVSGWRSLAVKKGDILAFGYPKSGIRSYLGVAGGFQLPLDFGSCATVRREGFGGLHKDGQSLQVGDELFCCPGKTVRAHTISPDFIPDYEAPLTVRVVLGQQAHLFSSEQLHRFFQEPYAISPKSDRMGIRFVGPALEPYSDGIVSEGSTYGAIQVPMDGQPIVLMKDCQTIGGYPKLGTGFALDLFQLAQRHPNTAVAFAPMPLHDAQRLLRQFYRFFNRSLSRRSS